MEYDAIHFNDWHRIFFGEVPFAFYIEVIIRTAVIYLILMTAMRMMGKKMASQLGRNEMVAMISLAAAIGVPLQSPDRGLLPAVIIAVIVVCTQQFIAKKATRSEKFESLTHDDIGVLVENGMLNLKVMKNTRITRERVFGQLRYNGLYHLGEVKRMYLEANGTFTLIENTEPVAGLSILPDWDAEFKHRVCKESGKVVCNHCGKPRTDSIPNCDRCGHQDWLPAVE
ncbi:DUF421 domain-containing protein [Dyadobacter psychrotolerans]|uniref:DUF421 domain-containing protein n=1 Tax=Dyadobacter psychrotolerans TaxID=2541721 RepID=A0A4R5DKC8_9BACT|nr:YetF domain-containing protein [Dyadobacter psychrotolerans]TDE14489.1 DUF421 domain-containing protein [Dyadobacter psychrotolerans]